MLKRVSDNAQGRKPRGRGYGVCLELGIDDVVGSSVGELNAGVIDACKRCFRDGSVAVELTARVLKPVVATGDRQPRSG